VWLATKASLKDHLHFYKLYFRGISNMKTNDHVQCHILKMGTHRCHVELQGPTKWPYRLLWLGVGNGGTLCQVNRGLLFKVPRALLVWGQLPKKGKLHKALTSESVEKEMLIAAVLAEWDLEHVKFYLHPSLYQLKCKVPKTCKEGISPLNVGFSSRKLLDFFFIISIPCFPYTPEN